MVMGIKTFQNDALRFGFFFFFFSQMECSSGVNLIYKVQI